MLKLNIPDTNLTSASTILSWQLDKEDCDPNVLGIDSTIIISIYPEKYDCKKEYRKVLKLNELMTYVEFRYPGKNKILAIVSNKSLNACKETYLKKVKGWHYNTLVYSYDTDYNASFESMEYNNCVRLHSTIEVDIPKECFAPEPSDIEKTWVNHYYENKAYDQCQFRNRRLFAYTLQPFLFMVGLVIRLIFTMFYLLIGFKNVSIKYLMHPFIYSLFETVESVAESELFYKGWMFLLHPAALAVYALAIFKFQVFLLIAIPILTVLAGYNMIKYFVKLMYWIPELIGRLEKETIFQFENKDKLKQTGLYLNQKYTSLADLPASHKTIKLRYQDLKSKVCKPFSS